MLRTETTEMVVLVDETDQEIGVTPKATVHHQNTPLHRGFSIYIFTKDKVLIQQRNVNKLTWPGFWSNSCCGHPGKGESCEQTAQRRVAQELNIKLQAIEKISNYRYRFEHNGIFENEVCPILVGFAAYENVRPDPSEVECIRWLKWSEYMNEMQENPELFSPWSKEQVKILSKSARFKEWLDKNGIRLA